MRAYDSARLINYLIRICSQSTATVSLYPRDSASATTFASPYAFTIIAFGASRGHGVNFLFSAEKFEG